MSKFIDLTGRRFGKLVVIERAEDYVSPNGKRAVSWICKCDCGCTKTIIGNSLKRHGTKSCGCLCNESGTKRFKKKSDNKASTIVEKVVDKMDNHVDNNVNNNISFADAYSKFEKWLNEQSNKSLNIKSTMLWSALKLVSDMNVIDEDVAKKMYGEFMFKQMEL